MPGNQLKQAFQSRIEAMQVQGHGIQLCTTLVRHLSRPRPSCQSPLNHTVEIGNRATDALPQFPIEDVHSSTP